MADRCRAAAGPLAERRRRLGNENVCFPIGKLKNLRLGNENTRFPVGKLKNLKNLKSEHRSKQIEPPASKMGIS